MSFSDVEYFIYYAGKYTKTGATVIDGIYANIFNIPQHGDLVFVDFSSDQELYDPVNEIDTLTFDDFFKSEHMCAAREVDWEETPILQ